MFLFGEKMFQQVASSVHIGQLNIDTTGKTSRAKQERVSSESLLITSMLRHLNQTGDSWPQEPEFDHHCWFEPE